MGSDQLVGALTDEQTDTVILTSSAKEDEGDRYLERPAGPRAKR